VPNILVWPKNVVLFLIMSFRLFFFWSNFS